MLAAIVYGLFGFMEFLIGLRFILKLLGANPASGFVAWIYSWSGPFVAPFGGIFGQGATATGQGTVVQSVFDWTALIALIVVGLIGALLGRVLRR